MGLSQSRSAVDEQAVRLVRRAAAQFEKTAQLHDPRSLRWVHDKLRCRGEQGGGVPAGRRARRPAPHRRAADRALLDPRSTAPPVPTRRQPLRHHCDLGHDRPNSPVPWPRSHSAPPSLLPCAKLDDQHPPGWRGSSRVHGGQLAGWRRWSSGRRRSGRADAGTATCRPEPRSDRLVPPLPTHPDRCPPPRRPGGRSLDLRFPRRLPRAAGAERPGSAERHAPRRYAQSCGRGEAARGAR
jgi:hypothetical protein